MSQSFIGEQLPAEISELQKPGAILGRPSAFTRPTEILAEDPTELGAYSSEYLAPPEPGRSSSEKTHSKPSRVVNERRPPNTKKKILNHRKSKPRFGLPEGFRPRLQQYGRSLLLDDNIYALSGGQEFIPKYPTGTLGKLSHLYALLTVNQFNEGRRGSVYVRNDGRIFDYSMDHADPSRDMFDTGYTIYDLKRTGRYASNDKLEKKQNEVQPRKVDQA